MKKNKEMNTQSIYTEKNNCQDCYKCVRRCPVKAIKIEDHSASIIPELCINCGYCTIICPAGAKKIRDDVGLVRHFIQNGERVVAALAPAWVSEFIGVSASGLISTLKQLGFSEVAEVALGAEMVSGAVAEYLQKQKTGLHISSCCPSVVSLIGKYYPEHLDKLVPIMSPMLAHARFLKENYGENIKVVFIGPCIAKKDEVEEMGGFVDAAITFSELETWMEKEGVEVLQYESTDQAFFPAPAGSGVLYPVDGGMINSLKKNVSAVDLQFMAFSGRNRVKDILNNIEGLDQGQLCFLELLSCSGGCVNGPGCTEKNSIAHKRAEVIRCFGNGNEKKAIGNGCTDLACDYNGYHPAPATHHPEEEIIDALKTIGKFNSKDYLNCSGCGYENCRDFAIALMESKAERSMCVSYMRRVAQNKASVLLQKMPYGVVMCDEHLHIIESNHNFASLLGKDTLQLFDDVPGLEGADLKSLFDGHKLFRNVLDMGLENFEKDIRINGKLCHLSIFSIQKHKILCGVLQNLHSPEVRNEEVVKRSREVIRENLETVQKVAFLLGETAAKTETMLNSIIQTHANTESEDV
ncbi:MAG: 4Fe-4S binding protein [Bacteroidales bacterium]|nr:4Fe-4S binding protein [Bacteroidales bacterium]